MDSPGCGGIGAPARLHHLALGARDVGSLAGFYREVLGLRELERHDEPADGSLRSVWLDLGCGAVLMIEKTDHPARASVPAHESGLFLLALTTQADAMLLCREKLAEKGIREERATEFTHYFRDPEGNRFALSCYPLPG